MELTVLLGTRFRVLLRMVTLAGTLFPSAELRRGDPLLAVDNRGEAFGVELLGGGSLERTEWTLSSIFCIRPIKPLI